MYRRTRKYDAERQRRAQATRERNRIDGPAPAYPAELPELRMRITIDGKPWRRAGLSAVLEGIRKACPRVASPRALV